MKSLLYSLFLGSILFISCQDETIGFLEVENASYIPDSLIVKKTPDPIIDELRITNKAPWVSPIMQGVLGTNTIFYELAGVTTKNGNAEIMKNEIQIIGGGTIYVPFKNNIPKGDYFISIRIYNEGRSFIKQNVFKIKIVD